jgi:TonB family protein
MYNWFTLITLFLCLLFMSGCASRFDAAKDRHVEEVRSGDVSHIGHRMPEMIGGPAAIYDVLRYPDASRERREQGRVILEFLVTRDGYVRDVTVLQSSGFSALDRSAVQAMSRMLYIPAVLDGERIDMQMTHPVIFRLGN